MTVRRKMTVRLKMTLRRQTGPAVSLLVILLTLIASCTTIVTGTAQPPAPPAATSSSAPPVPRTTSATRAPAAPSTIQPPTSEQPAVTTVTVTPTAGSNQPVPAQVVDATDLLAALTEALNTGDRAAFVRHFTPAAALVAGRWWDNLAVAGFDAGSVTVYGNDHPQAELGADGTAIFGSVMAGVHHPFDGTDSAGNPLIGTTQYRMRVRPEADGTLRIVAWQAVRPAPWDCTCQLRAARTSRAVVVSPATDQPYARQVATAAEAALSFHSKLFSVVGAPIRASSGVVIYATGNERDLRRWFFARGDAVSDVTDIALAYVRDFPAPTGRAAPADKRTVGGARVALGPLPQRLLVSVLVHELVHYRYFTEPLDREWIAGHPDIAEGIAQYVMEFYMGTTPEELAAGRPKPDDGVMKPAMTRGRLQRLFTGKPPTARQLRTGSAADLDFWYVISASQFEYIASRSDIATAFEVASCAYQAKTVFACASEPLGASETQVRQAWADWVRASYR